MNGRNGAAALLVLRLLIGWLFLWHGLGKLVGPPFAGVGLAPFAAILSLHLPRFPDASIIAIATTIAAVEIAGGVLLILGMFTGAVASLLLIMQVADVAQIRYAYGLFGPAGWESTLVVMAILLALVLGGPGVFAIDLRRTRRTPIATIAAR